jgi:hypothetical protein
VNTNHPQGLRGVSQNTKSTLLIAIEGAKNITSNHQSFHFSQKRNKHGNILCGFFGAKLYL